MFNTYRTVILLSIAVAIIITTVDFYGIIHDDNDSTVVNESQTVKQETVIPEENFGVVVDLGEMACLATNIYHEARGESLQGQHAVGFVTLNRVSSKRYPNNVCDVVYQAKYSKWWLEAKGRLVPIKWKCQFTWYCDGISDEVDKNSKAWHTATLIAHQLLLGELLDPTNGATHYFNHNKADPSWRYSMQQLARIENHTFYSTR